MTELYRVSIDLLTRVSCERRELFTATAETVAATSVSPLTHETSWRPISLPVQQKKSFWVVDFHKLQELSAQKGIATIASVQSASVIHVSVFAKYYVRGSRDGLLSTQQANVSDGTVIPLGQQC